MMVGMVLMKTEFGSMRTHEVNALKGDLYTTGGKTLCRCGKRRQGKSEEAV